MKYGRNKTITVHASMMKSLLTQQLKQQYQKMNNKLSSSSLSSSLCLKHNAFFRISLMMTFSYYYYIMIITLITILSRSNRIIMIDAWTTTTTNIISQQSSIRTIIINSNMNEHHSIVGSRTYPRFTSCSVFDTQIKRYRIPISSSSSTALWFGAKRKKSTPSNSNNNNNNDDFDHWYDEVDQSKTPDDVFWEEMERQRLLDGGSPSSSGSVTSSSSPKGTNPILDTNNNMIVNGGGGGGIGSNSNSGGNNGAAALFNNVPYSTLSASSVSSSIWNTGSSNNNGYSSMNGGNNNYNSGNNVFGGGNNGGGGSSNTFPSMFSSSSSSSTFPNKMKTPQQQQMTLKSIDATLSEYDAYMASDNWLDDDILEYMMANNEMNNNEYNTYNEDDDTIPTLEEQLDAWEMENNNNNNTNVVNTNRNKQDDNDDDDDSEYEYYYEEEDDEDDDNDNESNLNSNSWMLSVQSDEPWDQWSEQSTDGRMNNNNGKNYHPDNDLDEIRIKLDPEKVKTGPASQFLFHQTDDDNEEDDEDVAEDEQEEIDYVKRLSQITIYSERLHKAKDSTKAKTFFNKRKPNSMEGYDRLWISAIDNACIQNLVGTFRNYGIEFIDNFGDWIDLSINDTLYYTIEEIASYKARLVYNITGLPCIASRTSWEIEPIPDWNRIISSISPLYSGTNNNIGVGVSGSSSSSGSYSGMGSNGMSSTPNAVSAKQQQITNPRIISGYRFNDVGMYVDYICDAMRLVSEPDRVTRFKTCLCYYDGNIEIFDYGICDVDLYFCDSVRAYIPNAHAINEMMKTLELTFGLEYQKWLRTRIDETNSVRSRGSIVGSNNSNIDRNDIDDDDDEPYGAASTKLRDRVLKEGKVLPNDIIDVSAFMDSMVDVNLMDECAFELSKCFLEEKPTKILTVATTGLVIALPMAKYLQVPVVYARKERNIVMADTYIAGYSSKTVGKNRELLVSKSHIQPNDRVLIIDDFLSSGASQEALLRIISEAGAISVGIGVLLEKVYDSGRQSLSGFNIPIHSLCRISSVRGGVIQLIEEDGFDKMTSSLSSQQSSSTSDTTSDTSTATTVTTQPVASKKSKPSKKK